MKMGEWMVLRTKTRPPFSGSSKLLSVCSAQSHSEMQIIVADHVELLEQWFRDAIVERRDGIKLVPQTWLKS
jgi:hypothetical protein